MTQPTEKSARKDMVASPRFDASEDRLDEEIFGSESAMSAFVRRFDTINEDDL